MLNGSRRGFLSAACATLLYGAHIGSAADTPTPQRTRIGLLLPLSSPAFNRAADSVRQGFLAAAQIDPGEKFEIAVYSTTDDPVNIATGYDQAIAESAGIVVGPLTRNGVSSIVLRAKPGIRLLVLNVPDQETELPEDVYSFSLQLETEARQIARMAHEDGRRSALVVSDTPLIARRIHRAFVDEFIRLGGKISAEFVYQSTTADLLALRDAAASGQSDMAFLAIDGARARIVRGYLDGPLNLYATSQVLEGAPDRLRDIDLNGIRFVGMPWLLQADHPAVMAYSRSPNALPAATDFERLYAFGIDAYRIAADLARSGETAKVTLDGVTGRISLGKDRQFVRELTAAQFIDGRPAAIASPP